MKIERGRIILVGEFPPIPDRRFDWRAYHDGEEETNHCGWGATASEAVEDLKRMDEERADAMEPDEAMS